MKKLQAIIVLLVLSLAAYAKPIPRPKLVVGIVVDQMRYDFLYRYWDAYGERGFKRLLRKGYSFDQAHYPYAPTVTGPGHASVYTGSTPAFHGIAGNTWIDRQSGKTVYCTDDSTVSAVGAQTQAGRMSPKNMWGNTIGDQLRLACNQRNRVIGVALKDRGAILPAGHGANAAYWFDSKSGNWITSTYYRQALPAWAQAFNDRKVAQAYGQQTWAPLLPVGQYAQGSTADDMPYEGAIANGAPSTLPVSLAPYTKTDLEAIRRTPFGNQLTTDFALAALAGDSLGHHADTDMLCLSYSSTDYVGHVFGPHSVEAMDTYLRLDQDLARLLDYLDKEIGLKNTLIFLTADHGIAPIPAYARSIKLPGGRFSMKEAEQAINARLGLLAGSAAGATFTIGSADEQIYLNTAALAQAKISYEIAGREATLACMGLPWVSAAYTRADLADQAAGNPFARRMLLGSSPSRSGDIYLLVKPGFIEAASEKGTTHSSSYEYDTHVPMIFAGWRVRHGSSGRWVETTDIAPTICQLLHIMAPSASIGLPVLELRAPRQ